MANICDMKPAKLVRVVNPGVGVVVQMKDGSHHHLDFSVLQCLAISKDDHGKPAKYAANWKAIWKLAHLRGSGVPGPMPKEYTRCVG